MHRSSSIITCHTDEHFVMLEGHIIHLRYAWRVFGKIHTDCPAKKPSPWFLAWLLSLYLKSLQIVPFLMQYQTCDKCLQYRVSYLGNIRTQSLKETPIQYKWIVHEASLMHPLQALLLLSYCIFGNRISKAEYYM